MYKLVWKVLEDSMELLCSYLLHKKAFELEYEKSAVLL